MNIWVSTIAVFCVIVFDASIAADDRGYGTQFGRQQTTRGNQRVTCSFRGNSYQVGQTFSYTSRCYKYNCVCKSNGWYDCPKERTENICTQTQRPQPSGCTECNVYGVLYPGGLPFNHNRGCIELTDCNCNCNDGSWVCRKGVNLCTNTPLSSLSGGSSSRSSSSSGSVSSTSGSSYGSSSSGSSSSFGGSSGPSDQSGFGSDFRNSGCLKCSVDGKSVEPNTYFTYDKGCTEYSSCFCSCEGKWTCKYSSKKKICDPSAGAGIKIGNDGKDACRNCDVHGRVEIGNTLFTHRNGCHEWTDCQCNCDGSYNCPKENYRWACDHICRECNVNGRVYQGKTEFTYRNPDEQCILYDPCQCYCNGSWWCPPENGKWTCTDRCNVCNVTDGRTYRGGSTFRLKEGCWEWDSCSCNCNGSWSCPKENAKWTCSERCRECEVDGVKYPSKSTFQINRGDCWQLQCDCACNGSYNCPKEKTVDTCLINPQTGCYPCNVHGQKVDGNKRFNHTNGCIQHTDCICNCDGSWECPGDKLVDICRANSTTGCYYCEVQGQKIEGRSQFTLTRDDWKFNCECSCNGDWQCSSDATYIGLTHVDHVRGQCRDCYFVGDRHTSRSSFETQWGCIKHTCQCNCDGTIFCPAANAYSVCLGLSEHFQEFQIQSLTMVPERWCPPCNINNHLFPGNSQFEYVDGCHHHILRCYCNSGYRVAHKIVEECAQGLISGSIKYSKSSSVFLSETRTCRACIVNGKTHTARSSFVLKTGCLVYRCQCACIGQPQCRVSVNSACNIHVEVTSSSHTRVSSGGSNSSSVIHGGSSTHVSRGGTSGVVGGSRVVGGRVVSGGSRSSTTISGGRSQSGVIRGGSTVISGGSRVVSGGSSVINGGSSRRVVQRTRVVSGGSSGRSRVTSGGSSVHTGSTHVVVGHGTSHSNCRFCVVDGRRYMGNAVFDFHRGCVRYRCQCDCRGFAVCKAASVRDCFPHRSQCKQCRVDGQSYPATSRFTIQKDCQRISCRCECDGTATCSRTTIPGCHQHDVCRSCRYEGVVYKPYSQFHINRTCEKIVCQCNCNGEVQCASPIQTCTKPPVCRGCTVHGEYREGKSKFHITVGHWRFPCTCHCTGIHHCDRTRGEYIEDEPEPERCRPCILDGITHRSQAKFQRTQGCYRHNCQCFCDGSHHCVSTGVYVCGVTTTQSPCRKCRVDGKDYHPNTQFTIVYDECHSQNCRCSCDGRYECDDKMTNVCQVKCKPCRAHGKSYPPNERFQYDDKCHRHTCDCKCDGTHTCTRRKISRDCDAPSCKSCTDPLGQTHPANRRFRYEDKCHRHTCDCRCDGTYTCRKRKISDECDQPQCQRCTDPLRRTHPPNRRFQYDDRCHRHTCDCKCNGTYTCSKRKISRDCDVPACKSCTDPLGQTHPHSRRFQYVDRCHQHICDCNCDGTYSCTKRKISHDCDAPACKSCTDPLGNTHPSNRRFEYEDRCHRHTCECKCDGTYTCTTRKISRDCDVPSCKRCTDPLGHTHPGNSRFQYDNQCHRHVCDCKCDGTHTCTARKISHDCDTTNCKSCVDPFGRTHLANRRFQYDDRCHRHTCDCTCDGTYTCTKRKISNECDAPSCRSCTDPRGQSHQPNQRFQYDDACHRHTCDCKCNGTYTCTKREISRDCDNSGPSCKNCIDPLGRTHLSNQRFQYDDSCHRHTCDCKCDGNYTCTSRKISNACDTPTCKRCTDPLGRTHPPNAQYQYDQHCQRHTCFCNCDGTHTCTSQKLSDSCDAASCKLCQDPTGRRHRANTRFIYDDECVRHDCDCSCDGTYTCPPERARRFCSYGRNSGRNTVTTRRGQSGQTSSSSSSSYSITGQLSGQCRYCEVDGKRYKPNSVFEFERLCNRYNCDCACNGSYNCPASRTKDICRNQRTTCRDCTRFNQTYKSNAPFQYDDGCYRYSCDCNCDGSWNCPAERTIDLCSSERRSGRTRGKRCFKCNVGGLQREPYSNFKFDKGCVRFDCTCHCNGSYTCPAEKSQDICYGVRNVQSSQQCLQCNANGKKYPPNSDFSYTDGCTKHNCYCSCDGVSECPKHKRENICHNTASDQCRMCLVKDDRIRPGTRFQYIEGCEQFDCDCHCNGTWNCPADRTVNICGHSSSGCKKCDARGTKYPGNSKFVLREGCLQYECDCDCEGRWKCPKSLDVCKDRGDLG